MNKQVIKNKFMFFMGLGILFFITSCIDTEIPVVVYKGDRCLVMHQYDCGVTLQRCDSGKIYTCVSDVETHFE